ncbi:MAG TPA: alpha-galactosidase [Actinophytocola sp.]|uniref:alpha-galactosidase n=1 Tax=Actinophytocola sp. TaxID=1872138 RepID=UPI002DDCA9A6|nr:alpha-galactosidase [Actinophytocola sp.]HEV2777831.1 alpha-galactosidase [Actinophytocola sp.]
MAPVIYDDATRTWLLHTPGTSYVLRLDDEDVPRHVHWGRPLTPESAAELPIPAPPWVASFDGAFDVDAELPAEGGAMFGPAALQVRHPDGATGVEWRYLDHSVDEGHLQISFRDRIYPLSITLHYRVFDDSDVLQRWLTLRSDAPVTVLRCDSAQFVVPRRDGYRVTHVVGSWSGEFQLRRSELPVGETVLTSRRGITSHQANPWIMIDAGDADEDRGEVWSSALAWSGSWRITVAHTTSGRVGWSAGFGHDGLAWHLRPGEEWTTPVLAGLYTSDGFGGASRAWHAYTRAHVLPHPDELRPIVYNSWEATGFAITEANQKHLATLAAELGVEVFVVDDGWFGGRRADNAGLGDWYPSPVPFPDGLTPLIDHVHGLGMKFGLWVEPEMVNPDSDLYRAHPDWVLHQPNRRRTELRNQLVLNFARPDVAAWAHKWLDALVSDHRIDYLKWDMNRAFTQPGWPTHDDPDRLWIDHVRAVYSIIDQLRADHPHLRIQSCSGGGGRADLGILCRTDEVWTSDNTDAVDRIAIQHGYTHLYPARTMAAWVTDSPNIFTARSTPLRFRFHVAMAGTLGIGANLLEWTDSDTAEATALIAEYKEIRPTVQLGYQYRLGTDAVQYLRDTEVVIIAYRPTTRWGAGPTTLPLKALDPTATYHDPGTGDSYTGTTLLTRGLPLNLPPGDHASTCVRLTRG